MIWKEPSTSISKNNRSNKRRKELNTKKTNTAFPKFTYVLWGILALSILVYIAALISPEFADLYNAYPGALIRAALAYLTALFPLSVAEFLIISLPALLFFIIYIACKHYCSSLRESIVYIVSLLSCVSLFFSIFTLGFGCGYHGKTLDQKLEIEKTNVAPLELKLTSALVAGEVNRYVPEVEFGEDGFSKMPYSVFEMNRKLLKAYDSLCEKYDFIQKLYVGVKPVMLSEAMSYTHITGVYTYFTGEANINVNFPDYTLPFTAAHELAHQRGISREDEANFIAFLVCCESDDPYIKYSGYLNMYEYLASALSAQKDAYKEVFFSLDPLVRAEMKAYSAFFNKYRHSVAGKVSEKVNDTFLQVQGTVGTKSYGMVVDLAVAYYRDDIS